MLLIELTMTRTWVTSMRTVWTMSLWLCLSTKATLRLSRWRISFSIIPSSTILLSRCWIRTFT